MDNKLRAELYYKLKNDKDKLKDLVGEGKITLSDYIEITGDIWEDVPLEITKQNKLKEIWDACNKAILAGFYSSVSGTEMLYGFDEQDQANFTQQLLMLSIDNTIDTIYWKTKGEDGVVLPYTREQFMQLCNEAQQHKTSKIQKHWELKKKILNATTREEVEAIKWADESETATI